MKPHEIERARCERFLAGLREKDLLPIDLLEKMEQQVRQSEKVISAAAVAKRLIEAGQLTPALAKRLLAALDEAIPAEPVRSKPKSEEDELGLAPLEEELEKKKKSDDLEPAPPDEQPPAKTADKPPTKVHQPPASLLEEELTDLSAVPAGMGPLDGLIGDAAVGSPLEPALPKRKGLRGLFPRRRQIPGRKENVWDSPLLLLAGGLLLGLIILGGVLLLVITRGSGDEALKLANDEFTAGSYTQAISKYNQYLRKFPKHGGASLARVRRGLCRLRQATPRGTTAWSPALGTAKGVLAEIATETDFKEARGDLSVILLTIAEGLASQAHQATDPALVAEARESIALLEKHVPRALQQGTKLADVQASLAQTEHEIARDKELEKAVAAVAAAVSQGDTAAAYKIRVELLKQYPRLIDNEKLTEAVLTISRAQQAAVESVEQSKPAESTEPAAVARSTVTLARTIKTSDVPGTADYTVLAGADGAAYALDATTGRVLWRRFLGFGGTGSGPGFPPTPMDPTPGADVLLVDPVANEIQRLEGRTGRLRWRHVVGERFDAHPVLTTDHILVATRSGRLIFIDRDSGATSGYVQFPQSLRVAPAVDAAHGLIFQAADHSNLFVLGLTERRCQQVVYLGHEPGSITTPPVVSGQHVILAINDLAEDCHLHVLSIGAGDDADAPLCTPVQKLRLRGHVDTPPPLAGRRVLVATDLGTVTVYERGGRGVKNPLRKVAAGTVAGDGSVIRFPLMQGGQLWLGDVQLSRYEILTAHKRLVPKWIVDQQSVLLQPLVAIGRTIFSVRRKDAVPGVLVSATEMDEANRYWETQLAVPLVAEPIVEAGGGQITAVTAAGALFRLDPAGSKGQAVVDGPTAALDPALVRQPITSVLRLEDGRLVLSAGKGSKQLAVLDPQATGRFRQLRLPDPLACDPVALGSGLLAPTAAGGVYLVDPLSGDNLVEPFMPRLERGAKPAWLRPTALGDREALLCNRRDKLYRLGIKSQPKPHLAALAEIDVPEPIVSPVAVVGKAAYAVDAAGVLTTFSLPKLVRGRQWPLGGCPAWGPQRVGDDVILATDDGQLLCLDGTGKLVWQTPLPYGPLAGTPLSIGKSIVLAGAGGVVWRVEAATGRQQAKRDLGHPLGTGPVSFDGRLLTGGHDGTLYTLDIP